MRSKLYQVAFLLLCVSFLAVVFNHQRQVLPAVQPQPTPPQKIDVTYGLAEPINSLDPAEANNLSEAKVLTQIFEGLVRWRIDGQGLEPCLATSWETSSDGLSWTFKLRQGVKFHDGTPFNAQAVKFSVERQMPPQKKDNMAYGSFTYGMVKAVEALDDYTIKFTLKTPYSPFIRNLAMPWAAPIVSPTAIKKHGEQAHRHPVGTGPFYLVDWKGKKPVLLANDHYWGNKPKLTSLAFTYLSPTQRVADLTAGQLQLADLETKEQQTLPPKTFQQISGPAASLSYLGLFNNRPPFNNDKVRRAVCMAVDRKAIAQALFNQPELAANSLLPPNLLGYQKDLQPYSGGAQKAKELLRTYGYPKGLDITLITYNTTRPYNPLGGIALGELIKKQLAPAGIRVTVNAYPWHQFKNALHKQEGDAFLFGWVGDNLDPDNFFYTLLASGEIPRTNLIHYKNAEVDRLISAAQQEQDEQLRKRLYFHAQQVVLQDTPMIFLNYGHDSITASPKLKGITLNPFGIPLFASAHIVD